MKPLFRTGLIALILLAVVVSGFSEAQAQPRLRMKSRMVLNRTNFVIREAQVAVARNKVYTGNLARAVAHQRLARRMHHAGMFVRAVNHSRRARALAILAIEANRQGVPAGYALNAEEAAEGNVSDTQLDADLAREEPNAPAKDEAVLQETQGDVQ